MNEKIDRIEVIASVQLTRVLDYLPVRNRIRGYHPAGRRSVSLFGQARPFLRSLIAAPFASQKMLSFGLKRRFSSRPMRNERAERRLGQDGP